MIDKQISSLSVASFIFESNTLLYFTTVYRIQCITTHQKTGKNKKPQFSTLRAKLASKVLIKGIRLNSSRLTSHSVSCVKSLIKPHLEIQILLLSALSLALMTAT